MDHIPPGFLSMGFSKQEYWSELPCPPPGDLPDSGIKPKSLMSPALAGGFFTTSVTWEALVIRMLFSKYSFPTSLYSVQPLSRVWLFATPSTAAYQASLSITHARNLLKLMSIESVMPSNHLILCRPLLLLLSIFPSNRVFSNESVSRIRWPKYWSFSFSISPSNEYSGLISFRIDWLDFLAVQGTLKSLLQRHSSKASVLLCSAFFIVQLSHPYMTTGKSIALTTQTFVGKVMTLLFNTLSRLVITFLSRSKCLNFIAAVTICSDFETQKNNICHCFHWFPISLSWSDGTRCQDLSFLNAEF